jgi:alpha-tubulin suppressor-like RCC1 family protein
MKRTGTTLSALGIFCLGFALTVSQARAQAVTVTPADPVIDVGKTQQFTATGNLTPSQVSASGSHACALLPDGTLRCWGYNEYGQLGDGTTTHSSTPVAVAGITAALAVAAGHHHTCALLADGTVGCWGKNEFGQLGNGATCEAPPCKTPLAVAVSGISTAVAVSPGAYHTCALLADSTVRCWGHNMFGQLGNGANTNSSTPVDVAGLPPAVAVTAGGFHTCALLADGTVQCWGRNDGGQLGDGATPDSSTPVAVSGLGPAAAVSAGAYHTCARLPDGSLKCWGRNTFGQLGNGASLTYLIGADPQGTAGLYESTLPPGSHSRTPVEVVGISRATAVATGGFHTCAALADGSTKCWGQNDRGQLGDGTNSSKPTPVAVSGLAPFAAVTAGAWHTCALLPDGAVRCWGWNFAGQLGNGTITDFSTPVAVTGSGPVTWTSSATAVATIDEATGLATAHDLGSTTITATATGASGSTVLTVMNRFTLSVVREGAGNGSVSSSPAGITCGPDCSEAYPSGTVVTLTAAPDSGSTFEGWAGGGCTDTGDCTVTVTADTTVIAGFGAAPAPSP